MVREERIPMNSEQFDEIVSKRCEKIRHVLSEKAKEYANADDRLHNFNRGAEISGTTREKVLWGFALKHYISFLDMLDDIEEGDLPTEEYVDEKIGDLINYLILTEASIKDRIWNQESKITVFSDETVGDGYKPQPYDSSKEVGDL